jgi:DNA-3-methyladenine glycosylase
VTALPRDCFARPGFDFARALVGMTLAHGGAEGAIVETEAYHYTEEACHAYVGLTPRTRVLWGPPGVAYVYRSYGIHALFNVVCEPDGVGAAVLVRALEPTAGIERMRERRGPVPDRELCNGPGKLTQALGIGLDLNGTDLVDDAAIVLGPRPPDWAEVDIVRSAPRIGITRAVDLDWRFTAAGHRGVSRPWPSVGGAR